MGTPIRDLIINCKNRDNESYSDILNVFSDKLSYWKRRLNNPDADSDLNYFLFSLLINLDINKFDTDNDALFYIKACIENRGRKIEKDISKSKEREILSSDNILFENVNDYTSESDFSDIEFMDLLKPLNEKEKDIIYKRYFLQLTDQEISEELHVSRQAVNKSRRKALEKIMLH